MVAIDASDVGEYQRRDTGHVNSADRPTKYDYDRYIKLVQIGQQAAAGISRNCWSSTRSASPIRP